MYTIYLIFLLCCAVPFLFVMLRDPRTLWSGVWFVLLLGGLAGGLLLVSYQFLDWLSAYPALRNGWCFWLSRPSWGYWRSRRRSS